MRFHTFAVTNKLRCVLKMASTYNIPHKLDAIGNQGFISCSIRGYKPWLSKYYKDLYKRRLEVGPEPERHRSEWSNWNYSAELYAFGQRLGEDFTDNTLRLIFTHKSYVDQEAVKRAELGIKLDEETEQEQNLWHNDSLAQTGYERASKYLNLFLRFSYPYFPEEGIRHVREYLLSDEVASFIACNIGVKDLVLCSDFPPTQQTLSKTLFSVIGGLLKDQGEERADTFICDFIVPQILTKDINELWPINDPMGLLCQLLSSQGRPEPVSRLTRQTGSETVMSVFFVGIYCDRDLIGEAPGETLPIAEEMAARNALRRLFRTEDNQAPLRLGTRKPSTAELSVKLEKMSL